MKKKTCENCGEIFSPHVKATVQKFCCRNCKDRAYWKRDRKAGKVRSYKGGYPRAVVLEKWLELKK